MFSLITIFPILLRCYAAGAKHVAWASARKCPPTIRHDPRVAELSGKVSELLSEAEQLAGRTAVTCHRRHRAACFFAMTRQPTTALLDGWLDEVGAQRSRCALGSRHAIGEGLTAFLAFGQRSGITHERDTAQSAMIRPWSLSNASRRPTSTSNYCAELAGRRPRSRTAIVPSVGASRRSARWTSARRSWAWDGLLATAGCTASRSMSLSIRMPKDRGSARESWTPWRHS